MITERDKKNKEMAVNIVQALFASAASSGKLIPSADQIAEYIEIIYKKLKELD